MFASKGIGTVEASGSKLGRGESRQRRGAERQRYRTSFCRYQGNISQRQTKRLLFLWRKSDAWRDGWGAERDGGKVQRKREERRTVRASLGTEKRDEELWRRRKPLRTPRKIPAPPMPEVSAQLRCKKLKKAMGALLFCAWFFGTAVGWRGYFLKSEVPFRRTLQNKRAGARKFKRKGNKGVAHTAGAEMTGEPKKRRKSKKCRLQPAGQSCGNRWIRGKNRKNRTVFGRLPVLGVGREC